MINVSSAKVRLELETDKEIDYSNCTDAEKEFITVLAAFYPVCYFTGGFAIGLSYYDAVTSGILWRICKKSWFALQIFSSPSEI